MSPVLFCFPLLLAVTLCFLFMSFSNRSKKMEEAITPSDQRLKCSEIQVQEAQDLISRLPDHVLSHIISYLPTDEALRTSAVSKRWLSLWTYTSRLDLNQKRMLDPAFQSWFQIHKLPSVGSKVIYDGFNTLMRQMEESSRSIKKVLTHHCGALSSCRIIHPTDSCKNGDAAGWIRYLLEEKEVQELDMECQFRESWDQAGPKDGDLVIGYPIRVLIPSKLNLGFGFLSRFRVLKLTNYILSNSPLMKPSQSLKTLILKQVWLSEELLQGILFNCVSLDYLCLIGCKQFKKLRIHSPHLKFLELGQMTLHKIEVFAFKLEVMLLDTLVCNWKGLVIDAPNLRAFRVYYSNPVTRGMPKLRCRRVLLTTRVILGAYMDLGLVRANIFGKLVALCIDLNLNGERDIKALSFALKSSIFLEHLWIHSKDYNSSQNSPSFIYSRPWERREPCVCISQKLKKVCITGVKGSKLELEFLKYLITRGTMLKKMTVCFDDNCTRDGWMSTMVLLSEENRASSVLSISLVAGRSTKRLLREVFRRRASRQGGSQQRNYPEIRI